MMSVQQIHSHPLQNTLQERSAADRERALWIASGRYMRNEISVEQLEEAERPHVENLKRSVLRIALLRLFKP